MSLVLINQEIALCSQQLVKENAVETPNAQGACYEVKTQSSTLNELNGA